MQKVYSVIGTHRVPEHYNKLITKLAEGFKKEEYNLRTLGRQGFEQSAMSGACYRKQVIPGNNWTNKPIKAAYDIAWDWSPRWLRMTPKQQRRRAYIVQTLLGAELNNTSKFLITYTEDRWTAHDVTFAIRLAHEYQIPIYDLAEMSFYKLWTSVLDTKLCIDCKYYLDSECDRSKEFKVSEKDVKVLRFYDTAKNKYNRVVESCGIDGKWFEGK